MSLVQVRRLQAVDVEDYRAIRLAALQREPEAFGSPYATEAARPLSAFAERLATSTVLGAYAGEQIVGMVVLKQQSSPKDRHKGFVSGFYVEPDWRGQGIGLALMNALIAAAREHRESGQMEQIILAVVEGNHAAISLYRKLGFTAYGVEPRALKDAGRYWNEVWMILFLHQPNL